MNVLVTGGAGFVGSNIAIRWKAEHPKDVVYAFDNLRRRGSELALPRLRKAGVEFVHGDIRSRSDLESVGTVGLIVECSAEPSVHAGYGDSPEYVIQTNLIGTINALELARRERAKLIFLSSSRIYPIDPIRTLPLEREGRRFQIPVGKSGIGWSRFGLTENFPLDGHRSIYGATKLASELLVEEYRHMYGLHTAVNRCGVLTGPWQMGKVDQGFVVLWAARHLYGGKLSYMGFGGEGIQVRDILHVDDLYELLCAQVEQRPEQSVYNVGGGLEVSVSLQEATEQCQRRAGRQIEMGKVSETRPADIPWYISDCTRVQHEFVWSPKRTVDVIFDDIFEWLEEHRSDLYPLLGPN
ncbi:MAG: NAD-dependent epimerase/dehydratase family protein [Myxococcota bacterium]|nr:NAD-dependent epimerase/dehydratase family protein [Myxococcota bacterium]